jgi:anti-sigma regulatory factor (Ser/Thr protein kinase)
MRRRELIFIDHLDANGNNQNPERIVQNAVLFLEKNFPEVNICLFRHNYTPNCYFVETSSPNAEKYLNQLIKINKKSFKKNQLIYEIDNLLIFPLTDDGGKVKYVFVLVPENKVNREMLDMICDDIRKIFYLATIQIRQCSNSLNEKMAHLVSQIAHDFNSLVVQIPADAIDNNLLEIKKNYAMDLSREIMFYIRELETVRSVVSVKELLAGIVAGISFPDNVRLELKHNDEIGYIQVDVELMEMAISAILENAIFASGIDGGEIRITVQKKKNISHFIDHDWLDISIKDNGPGIPAEFIKHIKDPLFTTWKDQGHVGLGLSNAEKIIRAHDGDIHIESHAGEGMIVTVFLPLSDGNE